MKKLVLMTVFLMMAVYAVNAQRELDKVSFTPIQLPNAIDLPAPLPKDFIRQNYPDFTVRKAFKVVSSNDGVTYEVEANNGKASEFIYFSENGTFLRSGIDKVSLTPIQLPNAIDLPAPLPKDFLRQNYPDFFVRKAYKVVSNNNEVTYEVEVSKGNTGELLYFSDNGAFLKSEINKGEKTIDKPPVYKKGRRVRNPSIK